MQCFGPIETPTPGERDLIAIGFVESIAKQTGHALVVKLVGAVSIRRLCFLVFDDLVQDQLFIPDDRVEADVVLQQHAEDFATDLCQIILGMEHDCGLAPCRIKRGDALEVRVCE